MWINAALVRQLRNGERPEFFKAIRRSFSHFVCTCAKDPAKGPHLMIMVTSNGLAWRHHIDHFFIHLPDCDVRLLFEDPGSRRKTQALHIPPLIPNWQIGRFFALAEKPVATPNPEKERDRPQTRTRVRPAMEHVTPYGFCCTLLEHMGLTEHHPDDPVITPATFLKELRAEIDELQIIYGSEPLDRLLCVAGADGNPVDWQARLDPVNGLNSYGLLIGVVMNYRSDGDYVRLSLRNSNFDVRVLAFDWARMQVESKFTTPLSAMFKGHLILIGRVTRRDGRMVCDEATLVAVTHSWIPVDSMEEIKVFNLFDRERRHYSRPLRADLSFSHYLHDAFLHDGQVKPGQHANIGVEILGRLNDPEYKIRQEEKEKWSYSHPERELWFFDTRHAIPPLPFKIHSTRLNPLRPGLFLKS